MIKRQVSMLARHFGRSPETLAPGEIHSYQVRLALEKKLAPQFHQPRCSRAPAMKSGKQLLESGNEVGNTETNFGRVRCRFREGVLIFV